MLLLHLNSDMLIIIPAYQHSRDADYNNINEYTDQYIHRKCGKYCSVGYISIYVIITLLKHKSVAVIFSNMYYMLTVCGFLYLLYNRVFCRTLSYK